LQNQTVSMTVCCHVLLCSKIII